MCSELLEVLYFNIWWKLVSVNLLLQEININGIFSFGGATVLIVNLENLIELIIQHVLEFLSVCI